MEESILSKFFRDIEDMDGTGTCTIHYKQRPSDKNGKLMVHDISFEVELLVPFSHNNNPLFAMGHGKFDLNTSFLVNSMGDITYPLQQGRMKAFKRAVHDLTKDIKSEMLKVRPTTSTKKQSRKVRSILSQMGATGLDRKETP